MAPFPVTRVISTSFIHYVASLFKCDVSHSYEVSSWQGFSWQRESRGSSATA